MRKYFTKIVLSTLVLMGAMAGELAAKTQIYDASQQKWVDYDPSLAVGYYQTHKQAPKEFRRQVVKFRTAEKPGTIIIDSDRHFLYLIMEGFKAMRYGIGVGRDGFGWSGIVRVGRKKEWPTWTPPKEMIAREPYLVKYANGMPGGENNPLGARSMYLFVGKKDSIYRIHGTNQPWSIGLNISSGCVRLINDDVADLYNRVDVDAKVIMLRTGASLFKGV